jgi:hypothetical protein
LSASARRALNRSSHSPRRLSAVSSHRVRKSHSTLWVGAYVARVGAPRSLRIAFGDRILRVGSPRSLRIAFGGQMGASAHRDLVNRRLFKKNLCCCTLATCAPHGPVNRQLMHATCVVVCSQNLHRNMCTCSLRIAFGGQIVRVGSPCPFRIAFGGRIVRVGAPRLCTCANFARVKVSSTVRIVNKSSLV